MIDEAKIEALRANYKAHGDKDLYSALLDTIEALYKVVRAAEKASSEKDHTNCWHDELEEALTPFRQEQEPK